MSEKAIVTRPKVKAIYSLQFYRDRDGTLCLSETGNSTGKKVHMEDGMSCSLIGLKLADKHKSEKSMLNDREKDCLKRFFSNYLEQSK